LSNLAFDARKKQLFAAQTHFASDKYSTYEEVFKRIQKLEI